MNRSMVKTGLALLLMSLHFCMAVPVFAQSRQTGPTVAEIALDRGPDRLQRLIAGAKKKVNLRHMAP